MSTPDAFDPYRKWLGIPPHEQPPNHYRLLGVGLFEDDADTIASAADRQMAHVRTFQTGPHSAVSQKLLNELAAARIALLDPKKKAAYDEQLRAKLAPPPAAAPAGQGRGGAPLPVPVARAPSPAPVHAGVGQGGAGGLVATAVAEHRSEPLTTGSPSRALRRRRSRQEPAVWVGVLVAASALAAAVYYVRSQSSESSSQSVAAKQEPATERAAPAATSESIASVSPPESDSEHASAAPDEAAAEPTAEAAMPDDVGDRSTPLRPETPPSMSAQQPPTNDAPLADKPRTLGDLAAVGQRSQLTQLHRDPPPDRKALMAANARFTQLYGKEIAGAKNIEAVRKVAMRQFYLACEGANSADVRHVMLNYAGTVAASQGNLGMAYRVASEAARQFELDPLSLKVKALDAAAKNAPSPRAYAIGALQALALAERAVGEGKFDVSAKAASQATSFAKKTRNKDLTAQVEQARAALRERLSRYAAYKKAVADLKKSPEDQAANLTAGKFDVLVLGNWKDGLARLAVSGDARLNEVAGLEAEARLDPSQWVPLAAAWWKAAEQETDEFFQSQCRLQARYCRLRARQSGRAGGLPADVEEQLRNLPGYPMSRLVPGVAARYYDGAAFEREKLQRVDPAIDFFFGQNSPDPSVSTDFFSARWTGFVKPPVTGRYQIATFTDNSVRLWVDGNEVLNRWGPGVAGWQQTELDLTDEPHTFRFEFNDTIGHAVAMFGWTLAAFPDDQHAQKSPIDALYYDPESPFELPDVSAR